MSDPKAPVAAKVTAQLSDVAVFAKLSPEQQNKAVPELLLLLKNETPITPEGQAPAWGVQIRHRAAAALTRIAAVCPGQFPTVKPDESADVAAPEQGRKESDRLVAWWNAWWKTGKDLDDAGRKDAARKLRSGLLNTKDEELFWVNVQFCQEDQDPAPLPRLGELLKAIDLKQRAAANRVISAYGNLCSAPGAPADAGLLLVDFLRKNNTVDNCSDGMAFMTLRSATTYLRRITGSPLTNYLEVKEIEYEQNGEKATRTVHMITEEAIKSWEDAIKAKASGKEPRPAEQPADGKDKPAGTVDANAPAAGVQVLELQNQNGVMKVQIRVAPAADPNVPPKENK